MLNFISFYSLIAMKINLPFHSYSVVKVITNACLLILIISAVHIISVFATFNSHIENMKIIDKLTSLKISTNELIYSVQSDPAKLHYLVKEIDEHFITDRLFESSWFNTQQINQAHRDIPQQWKVISNNIDTYHLSETKKSLHTFVTSLNNVAKQYQVLTTKKMNLIYMVEIISFIFIAFISSILYLYSKKKIVIPIKQLIKNVKALKMHQFDIVFPQTNNEIGLLSQGIEDTSDELRQLIQHMQSQVSEQTIALENAHQTIAFLYTISQQLSTVKLTSPILNNALKALAQHAKLKKLCIELNNGTFINTAQGCASVEKDTKRIAIIINGKPYGFLNYVSNEVSQEQHALIESFTGLVARALYQEEMSLQEQKILLMEERSIIARELHDSIAQSLSFLKIQCTLLHRQLDHSSQAQQTIFNIQQVVSDAYIQLRSLLATFRLDSTKSNFKEAMLTMIETMQKQTDAIISLNKFETNLYVDANQHIHLLQIVREAIVNAIKHAQCENINISYLITDEHNVWFNIIDDGLGILDNGQQHNHYGLSIMQHRADELGATLSINRLSKGTEVKLIYPYKGSRLDQGTEDE
tara:strand:- start:21736 stop:23490 length:1755 start_codon:yes stop_codon:yes gene_type:complete